MSNNIYDILKKMQSLETPKAKLTEGKKAKPDFLDMDKDGDTTEPMKKAAKAKSKGAVAEAIAQVERQLNEKYQGFKEDTRLAMRRGPGADMMRYDKDSPAPGAQQHRDATAKAAKDIRASGKKLGDQDEVKAGDKTVTRYSRTNEGEANEDMLSPGQKKIARMSPPPDKIDANDLAALRAGKEYAVKEGSPKKKTQSPDEQHKVVAAVRDAMRKGYDNVQKGRDERAAARFVAKLKYGSNDSEKTNEGFPTVADAKKRMDDRDGKTAHGKKTITKTGTRHERDYDAVDRGADVDTTPKGRGRPKKDRFA